MLTETQQKYVDALAEFGSGRRVAEHFGVHHSAVARALQRARRNQRIEAAGMPSGGIDRQAFKESFDPRKQAETALRSALQVLDTSNELFDVDAVLQMCPGVSRKYLKEVADTHPFLEYQVEVKGKRFWCSRSTVEWALENVSLAHRPITA